MDHDPRLQRIQANRAKTGRVRPVSEAVNRVAASVASSQNLEGMQEVLSSISVAVDDEFRRRCRVSIVGGTTLLVNVDSPALVYAMRLQWLTVLRGLLAASRRAPAVCAVTFGYGTAGLRLPDPTGLQPARRPAGTASGRVAHHRSLPS